MLLGVIFILLAADPLKVNMLVPSSVPPLSLTTKLLAVGNELGIRASTALSKSVILSVV